MLYTTPFFVNNYHTNFFTHIATASDPECNVKWCKIIDSLNMYWTCLSHVNMAVGVGISMASLRVISDMSFGLLWTPLLNDSRVIVRLGWITL